jgi:hypothetical protein
VSGAIDRRTAAALALAAEPPPNVLVLYSDNRVLPGLAIIDETLDGVLRAEYGPEIDMFSQFLDLDRPRPAGYEDDLVEFLRKKYAGTQVGAIVAVRSPALKFLLQRRDQFLPGVPVVHVAMSKQDLAGMELPRDVIGVPVELQPEKTIEVALRLHPGTRRVVVITGISQDDRAWEALLRRAFKPLGDAEFEFWAALPLARFSTGCDDYPLTHRFLSGLRQDGTGTRRVPQDVATQVVSISPVPVYGNNSNFRKVGTMGGYIAPIDEIARPAAQLVARLLRGENPESSPSAVRNAYILNMHQLRRFGFDESAIPPDAILMYREPTLWEAYRWHIVVVVGLMLASCADRRTPCTAACPAAGGFELRESEQRMSLVATATGLGMWVRRPPGTFW